MVKLVEGSNPNYNSLWAPPSTHYQSSITTTFNNIIIVFENIFILITHLCVYLI